MPVSLHPASDYSIEQLADIYTHARKNYLVPMPMSPGRLKEYIRVYQIDLDRSLVAVEEGDMVGVGMLGLRTGRSWVTRMGVLAGERGKGIGEKLARGLLEISDSLGIAYNQLEVISGNDGAHRLFRKLGFEDYRELLVLDRVAGEARPPVVKADQLDRHACLKYLEARPEPQAWTNQTESVHQVKGVEGFEIDLPSLGRGWLVFQNTGEQLARLMFETSSLEVMQELLAHLHAASPGLDANVENIPASAYQLPALEQFGYQVSFRRIEMVRYLAR
jgi:ribosomal protein S18 acetylase RimI-like enzyme